MDGKWRFHGEAETITDAGGVHGARRWLVGWRRVGEVLRLQGKLMNVRQRFEKVPSGKTHEEGSSSA
jgi:hypothetical protein